MVLKKLWGIHKALRKLQAAYRIAHGKAPTTLPGEQEGFTVDKFKKLLVGKDSIKTPLSMGVAAAYFLLTLMGTPVPGLPQVSQDAAVTGLATSVGLLFLAFRAKKSGPTIPAP